MSPYPLAALLTLRGHDEARARTALARALTVEALRASERAEAAARCAAHSARLEREGTELSACEGGAIAALALRARHAGRLRAEEEALAVVLRESEEALASAGEEAQAARATLADARRALRALERHRGGWHAESLRRREARDEAEGDDSFTARRGEP